MKVLHLNLKKKWFDMILSGEKKCEYREIKPYWAKRLKDFLVKNPFDVIVFRNGYAKDAPTFTIECRGIRFGEGFEEWGSETGTMYYVIELGEIIK
jgi:uncharacterized protein (DUF736 family)